LRVEGRRKLLAADADSDRLLKSSPSGPAVGGPRQSWRTQGGMSQPCQGLLTGAAKHGFCVRKARKVGKVLSFMTPPPFLAFLTFLALGAPKKAAG
jgi:hypothetical protein